MERKNLSYEIVLKDTGENLLRNEEVKKAFLGG